MLGSLYISVAENNSETPICNLVEQSEVGQGIVDVYHLVRQISVKDICLTSNRNEHGLT